MSKTMERRQFLRLTGLAGAAAITAGALSGCGAAGGQEAGGGGASETVVGWTNVEFSHDVDVCVVGAGSSGLAAAYTAAKAGKSTLMIDKQITYGGDAATSANTWMIGYTDVANELRPESATKLEDQLAKYEQYYGDDPDLLELQKSWLTNTNEWVSTITHDLGVKWQETVPCAYTSMYFPEGGIGQGKAMWEAIYSGVVAAGAQVVFNLRGDSFIVDSENTVVGLRCWDEANGKWVDIKAKAFILCCGGFAANQDMIAEYYPEMYSIGCIVSQSQGEGIKLGQSVGGALARMGGAVNYNPHLECVHVSQALGRSISILPNGKRYYSETAVHNGPTVMDHGFYSWWIIWDDQITNGPSALQVKKSEEYRVTGNTVEELANAMNMDVDIIQGAFDNYNAICDAGVDEEFGRTHFLEKLEPPYYAIQMYPVRYKTSGGLDTDAEGHVRDEAGNPIPGVFAAGCTAGTTDIGPAGGSGVAAGKGAIAYIDGLA